MTQVANDFILPHPPVLDFAVQNWVVLPAPWPVDRWPTPEEQRWLFFLSGVAIVNFKGESPTAWRWDSLRLYIDLSGPIGATGRWPSPGKALAFQVEQSAPFATINAIYDASTAVDAGFAVDAFRPILISAGVERIPNVFEYLEVDLAVRDTDAWLYRVGYQITLLGRIVEYTPERPPR